MSLWLPWQKTIGKTRKDKYLEVLKIKQELSPEKLCKGLDIEFAKFISYCRSLKFEERPDYSYLHNLFKTCFYNQPNHKTFEYDWMKLNLNIKTIKKYNTEDQWTNEALGTDAIQGTEHDENLSQRTVETFQNEKKEDLPRHSQRSKKDATQRSVGYKFKVKNYNIGNKKNYQKEIPSQKYISELFYAKQKEGQIYKLCEDPIMNYEESIYEKFSFGAKNQIITQKTGGYNIQTNADSPQRQTNFPTITKSEEEKMVSVNKKNDDRHYLPDMNSDYIGIKKKTKPVFTPTISTVFNSEGLIEIPYGN